MAAYGGGCETLDLSDFITCNDDYHGAYGMPKISMSGLTPGDTIFIQFWEWMSGEGTFNICVYDPCATFDVSIGSTTDVLCNGLADGTATAAPTGGEEPYTYLWDPTGQTTQTATGLSAGNYTVYVTEANGCTDSATAVINEPDPIDLTFTKIDESCYEAKDGEIDLTVSGGTPPYTISWTGPNGFSSTDEDILNLEPGLYTVDVLDDNGCNASTSINIEEATQINVTEISASHQDVSCYGGSDGQIEVTASGGTSPYEFSLDGTNYQSSGLFTGLSANTYTAYVRDANGCIKTETVTVDEPASPLSGSITSQTNVECSGSANGSVTVEGSGGTSPYEYSIDGGVNYYSSGTFGSLTDGNYTVTIRDANGCLYDVPVTITAMDNTPPVFASTPGDKIASCNISELPPYADYTEFQADGGSVTDNCGVDESSFTLVSEVSDGLSCPETVERTYQIADLSGNAEQYIQTITVNDATDPVITGCPGNITQGTDAGICGASVTWAAPVATDNCHVASFVSTHNPGDVFPVGVTTVTYTATDDCGNTTVCQFDVTVNDAEPPVISDCPADIGPLAMDPGACGATVTWTDPTATDNCDGAVAVTRTDVTGLNSGDLFPEGITTISYEATDSEG
ncbi:MAG: HYR domain-containing protein, partial [Bacteroidales bacterium]